MIVCSPSIPSNTPPHSYSTKVRADRFYSFPHYSSTKDFISKCLFKPGYFRTYSNIADEVIKQYSGEYFWIRTPSMGSIVFGLRALKAGEKVLHHMCADASNTWRDAKYSLPEKFIGFLLSRYLRYKLKNICQHANTINLCTGAALEDFSKKYAPTRTVQFVDVMVKPSVQIVEKSLPQGFLSLLFVGRVVSDKGIFDLLRVVSRLKNHTQLTVVGDGPDLERAKALANDLGIADQIKFTGQLSHHTLSDVYASCDLVVIPSNNYYEGFPRVIMESWAHHKPVVISDVGGIRAFVRDQYNGLIFRPGDVEQLCNNINQLIQDPHLYFQIKEGAVASASISHQAQWISVLRKQLGLFDSHEA